MQERVVYCFTKKGTFVQEYESATEAANAIHYSTTSVLANIRGRVKSVGDFVFSHEKVFPGYSHIKNSTLQVDQFSLRGKHLKTYPNVMEAANAIGIDYVKLYRCIHENACLDTEYFWKYRRKKIPQTHKPFAAPNRPKIFQFDLEGKPIGSFKSIAEASRKTGIDRKQINKCCLRQAETGGGFRWSTSYFAAFTKIEE